MMRFAESVRLVIFLMGLLLLGCLGTWDETAPFWYGAALVATAGVATLISRQRTPARVPGWLSLGGLLLFYVYIAMRDLTSPVAWLARQDLVFATTAVIAYLLVSLRFTGPRQRGALLLVLALLILANVGSGLYQFSTDQKFMVFHSLGFARMVEKSASGFFANSNHMAGFLILASFPLLGVAVLGKGVSSFLRMLCGLVFGVAGLGIALSTSRGGMVAFFSALGLFIAAALVVIKSSTPKRKASGKAMAWWFFGLFGGFALLLIITGVTFRHFYGNSNFLGNLNGRGVLWDAALEQWQINPIFGTGGRSFEYMERSFRTLDTGWMVWAGEVDAVYAHNDFLQCLADYGLLGVILALVCLLLHTVHALLSVARHHAARIQLPENSMGPGIAVGAMCSLAGIAVHSLVDFNLHIGINVVMAGIALGLMATPGFVRATKPADASPPLKPVTRFSPALLCLSAVTAGLSLILLKKAWTLASADYYWAKGFGELKAATNEPESIRLWLTSGGTLEKAVGRDPENPKAWHYLGYVNAQLATQLSDRFADTFDRKALDQLTRSLSLYPQNPYAAGLAGSLADFLGEREQADAFFASALAWGINIQSVNNQFGDHLFLKKDYRKAIGFYVIAFQLSGDLNDRASIQMKINDCIARLKASGRPAPPEAFLSPAELSPTAGRP